YIMATSRIAHYLKVMARVMIGDFMEASECEAQLSRWIRNYVNSNKDAGPEAKARCPLGEATVKVMEIVGKPGFYNVVAWLLPWLPSQDLTTALRVVCRVPRLKEQET